jgi:hypothetical protein
MMCIYILVKDGISGFQIPIAVIVETLSTLISGLASPLHVYMLYYYEVGYLSRLPSSSIATILRPVDLDTLHRNIFSLASLTSSPMAS